MGRPPKIYTSEELSAARDRRNELRRAAYAAGDGRKEENRLWKAAHREQVREANRAYMRARRNADSAGMQKRERDWRAKNKDKVREYNRRNREGKFGREYNNAWQARNRQKNPALYMWRGCRNRAKAIGVEFTIKQTDIVIPEFCPVLGIKMSFNHGMQGFFANESPSVDRFDNTKGYTPENIKVISWRANMLKRDGTLDEFERIVAYMRAHQSCSCTENPGGDSQ